MFKEYNIDFCCGGQRPLSDDEIRDTIKEARKLLSSETVSKDEIIEKVNAAASRIIEMIFKEENILFPMVLETLAEDEWVKIAEESKLTEY